MITNKELAVWLESQIRLYDSCARNEEFSKSYRIRCYGCIKGFQLTLAMLNPFECPMQVEKLYIEGEEVC